MQIPHPKDFRHPSDVHGQAHVARVMVHAMRLIEATGWEHERARLWAAVYLHDLERTHDGVCRVHGARAVKRWQASVELTEFIRGGGVRPEDESAIARAVTLHCRNDSEMPDRDDPDWPLAALLKDADGLDRVRLGDLDVRYLRLPPSAAMAPFAEALHDETNWELTPGEGYYEALLVQVERLG